MYELDLKYAMLICVTFGGKGCFTCCSLTLTRLPITQMSAGGENLTYLMIPFKTDFSSLKSLRLLHL